MKKLSSYHRVILVSLLAGTALFAYLVERTGTAFIIANIRLMGASFFLILLTSAARQLLRTVTWYYCIEENYRRVRFLDLFNIRLAGESLGDLTFAGPLLGETAKSLAISRCVPMASSFSSIVVENLIFGLSVVLFIISGILVFLFESALPQSVRIAGAALGLTLLLPALAAYVIISRKWMLLTGLLNSLNKRGIHWNFLHRRSKQIRLFEENVYRFYGGHKRLFLWVLVLDLLASCTGVIEAFVILRVTAHQTSMLAAFFLESVNRAINLLFSFIPLRLGVDEGGAALTLGILGYGSATGVSLAIIRKIRALFWTAAGLLIMARYSMTPKIPGAGTLDLPLSSENEEINCQRR